ncbi:hypothetical protein [Aquipuribacter nitratireducens]|uniref:Integral membrane protein n=1 Tax=Aquipuribacter nitratireducens TaxID=650104 RepID=A0ABW0GRG4_9MICO
MIGVLSVPLASVPRPNPGAPPGSAQFLTILNWVSWGALVICVAGVIFAGIAMIISSRRGEGGEHIGKLGTVLAGCVVVGAASGFVTALV